MPRSFATGIAIAETTPTPDSAISPAGAAEVVSSNVVGYQKLSIPAGGYALLANPFTVVGSDGETFPINDMFSDDVGQSTAGNNVTLGDTIEVWDPANQTYFSPYFFSSRANNKWATSAAPRVATTESLTAGDGFWYRNRGSSSFDITVSGEVATNEVTITLSPGYTLVCNPFPADLPLNSDSIDWATAGATAGNNVTLGDTIEVWDSENQTYFSPYFFSSRANNKWATSAAPRVATTEAVPAGAGFWYRNRGSSDIVITLKSPLAAAE